MTAPVRPVLAAGIHTFTFHGATSPALREIRLSVMPGTLTAVLGGAGSGKTTLAKVLAGWLRPGQAGRLTGTLQLGEARLEFRGGDDDPRIDPAAWSQRVAYVPQDAAAMLSSVRSTVAEELAFGLENRGMPRGDMHTEVARTAALTGLAALLGQDPATLSGGELRRLAVGCAVITRPEVLVLDEPLASLDAAGAAQLLELLRGLLDAGTAVVLLSQVADGLARTAAHWIILDCGTVTASGPPASLTGGVSLEASNVVLPGWPGPAARYAVRCQPAPAATGASAVLELTGVRFGYRPAEVPVLQGVDLTVAPGEIVAITGPNGSGKSTLLRHFNGLLRPGAGDVRVCGASIAGRPAGTISGAVGLLFQHPRDQLFERTVLREVQFGLPGRQGIRSRDAAQAAARKALAAVGLADRVAEHPAELPSSQQRLLALATVLARGPALLVLDEPTAGLDRRGLRVLDAAVSDAAARGAGVVLVTHQMAYARYAAHRVLELRAGRLRELSGE